MKKSPYFTTVMLSVLVAWGGSRDTVSFTLTFADRPIPDMRGYEALWLTGEGVKSDLEDSLAVAYPWYGQALVSAKFDWKLTYDGYAEYCRYFRHVSADDRGFSVGKNLAKAELTTLATEICLEGDRNERKRNIEGVSRDRLTGFVAGCQPDGAPHPWQLPSRTGSGDCDAIVWNGIFYDLAARFGTEEAKKRILSVSSEYDRGERFCLSGRFPTYGFKIVNTGFRQIYTDGIGGEKIAELHVTYPGKYLGGDFYSEKAEDYFHPAVLTFVLKELQKSENRGKVIRGTYTYRVISHWGWTSSTWHSYDERIRVEGRQEEKSPSVPKTAFDGANIVPGAYADCFDREFSDADFPAGVKTIGALAFADCSRLGAENGSIRLPDGLESIGEGAFRGCWIFLESVEIPDSVTNIGAWAFCQCNSLRSVRLPKNLKEISDGLFYSDMKWGGCLEHVTIPQGVRRIGKYAFANCRKLKEIEIPNSVEEIDDYAFYGCKSFVRPKLAPSVRLGKFVFSGGKQ